MAEVSPAAPAEVAPVPPLGWGPISLVAASGVAATKGPVSLPCGFPQVNPLALEALPLLFGLEADKRWIERAVIAANDMGFKDLNV